ncbi:MAG TPA: selenide, water dikinase SelD [Acidimicrobiales bacterium]|nr:selenide, water dikinase SelD [Acidimicrobiales bacterium]
MTQLAGGLRLTQLAPGGGCSCKIGAGELEELLAVAYGDRPTVDERLLCGIESGDDATVVRLDDDTAVVTTTDFFPPMVDDPFDFGRIAAANALSDVYAMGGKPLSALNLLSWPTTSVPMDVAAEVLRGGRAVADEAGCILAGGHSIDDATPKYGLAVTGLVCPDALLRNDAARPGDPISLTKPIGVGICNNFHKATATAIDEAVAVMAALNREASMTAVALGIRAATDVTGFGLLGHLFKMARASGVTAVVRASEVPVIAGARELAARGYVPGGTRRNLAWVAPSLHTSLPVDDLLVLADAQTSGGLLVAGEIPGAPVIGEFVDACGPTLIVH